MKKEDEFKKEVIDLVYYGKYAEALRLLDAKVTALVTKEFIEFTEAKK